MGWSRKEAEEGQVMGQEDRRPKSFYGYHKPQGSPSVGRVAGGSVLGTAGLGCPWDVPRRRPAGGLLSRAGQGTQAMDLRTHGVQAVTAAVGW